MVMKHIQTFEFINEAVKVEVERYKRSHQKNPSGYGQWAFSYNRDGKEHFFVPKSMDYKDAVKWAKEEAQRDGEGYIYVMESVNEGINKSALKKQIKIIDKQIDDETGGDGEPLTDETLQALEQERERLEKLLKESVNEGVIGIKTEGGFKPKDLSDALDKAKVKYKMNRLSMTLTVLNLDKKYFEDAKKIVDDLGLNVMMAKESVNEATKYSLDRYKKEVAKLFNNKKTIDDQQVYDDMITAFSDGVSPAEFVSTIKEGFKFVKTFESVNEAKDNLYLQLHKKYADQIQGLKAKKIKKLTDLVSVQRWAMEDDLDMSKSDRKKMSAVFNDERKLFKQYLAGDHSVMLPESINVRVHKLDRKLKKKLDSEYDNDYYFKNHKDKKEKFYELLLKHAPFMQWNTLKNAFMKLFKINYAGTGSNMGELLEYFYNMVRKELKIGESVNEARANYHEYSTEDLRKMYREIVRNGSAQQKKVWKQGIKRELDKRGESLNEGLLNIKGKKGNFSGKDFEKQLLDIGKTAVENTDFVEKVVASLTGAISPKDKWKLYDWFQQNIVESVNEAKEVEVTQEMWDKEWKIRKTFGKEYEEHFAKRTEAAMSKAKNEEMAENWAFINWKQLPGKADGMTIKESVNEAVPSVEDYHSKSDKDVLFTIPGPHKKSLETSRSIWKDAQKNGMDFDEFFANDKGNESGDFLISFPSSVNIVTPAGIKKIIKLVGNRGKHIERPNWVNESLKESVGEGHKFVKTYEVYTQAPAKMIAFDGDDEDDEDLIKKGKKMKGPLGMVGGIGYDTMKEESEEEESEEEKIRKREGRLPGPEGGVGYAGKERG